jgi:hypothetical protein
MGLAKTPTWARRNPEECHLRLAFFHVLTLHDRLIEWQLLVGGQHWHPLGAFMAVHPYRIGVLGATAEALPVRHCHPPYEPGRRRRWTLLQPIKKRVKKRMTPQRMQPCQQCPLPAQQRPPTGFQTRAPCLAGVSAFRPQTTGQARSAFTC